MSDSERTKKAAEIGNNVAEFLMEPTGGDVGIALGALVRAGSIIIKGAEIDPVDFCKKLFEEVQNAIDGKELR